MATMMKRLRLIYALLLTLPLLVACTSDTADEPMTDKSKVQVRINISPASSTAMRASWEDSNAEDDEMMNIWTVVIVDESNKVVEIQSCIPEEDNREIDDITELPKGSYTFYSFANIGATELEELLSFDAGTMPVPKENSHEIASKKAEELSNVTFTSLQADNATISFNGNDFKSSSESNGFGSKGIPMSNKQTLTITENTSVDLVVVRLLAKIKLEITNTSSESVTIESVTLTDITKYETGKDNLKLFPAYIESASGDENKKDEYTHGHIQPNLNTGTTTEDVTVTVGKTIVSEGTENVTFYVNESATPTTNEFKHFFLKLKLLKGTTNTEVRYALIDDNNAENYEGKWDYIARNDYRIIPISLDDYKLELIPYDFPAIGVHPASVKEEDGLYTITFHDYGHFHLVPKVTKFTASGATAVPFSGTDYPNWTFVGTDFVSSWTSWTDHNKTTEYNNETANPAFYRKEGVTSPNVDADEAGGVPVWYKNDGTDGPQWQPNSTIGYVPFIFGYIADPEGELKTDRKVYHEFSIYLYKNGTGTPRQMIYRLYMILDTDQMLYRQNGAAPVRHTHGH